MFSRRNTHDNIHFEDMESIDALAKAVNEYEGGLVLVSHDMRLISQVAKEIWICDNKTISKHQGDIASFKLGMRKQMGLQGEQKKLLRGDFSEKVKEKVEEKETATRPAETKGKSVPAGACISEGLKTMKIEDDDVVATSTAATSTSMSTKAPTTNLPPSSIAPPKNTSTSIAPANRYVPPHLRKKMLEEQ
jgi:energy-coupling factor transporter ATP-binding protein EcfA2